MKMLFALLLLMSIRVAGQEIKVEYDKNHDFSKYKTFSFGENVVVTPTNQRRVSDATFDNWIKNGISRELQFKGMKRMDSLSDLIVTYAFVRTPQLDVEPIGPLGMTPGSSERSWSRTYTESTLIIDLNNHSNLLIWRVKGTFDVASSNVESVIDMIIARGFKKYGKGKKKKH
jgi:hypothetical protein